ncbi:MAG: flagellar hook-associated protein FlgL [Motilibacteraceae bacterium]
MTTFRITQRSVGERTLAGLQTNLARMGKLQEQLSSGKLISKPSDDPTGTVSALQIRSQVRTQQQWSRNASDGVGWLNTTDTTLTGMLGEVRRVRELALQGANSGAAGQDAREAMAAEVDKIKESLISDANTRYLDRPIFGGTTGGTAAYASDGTFLGQTAGVYRTAGDGAPVRIDVTGPEVFGSGASSLFAVVQQVSDDLRNNPASLSNDLGAIDGAMKNLTNRLSDVGARSNRLDTMRQAAEDAAGSLTNHLADVESIDLPATVVQLQLQQTAYQAALGATSRVVTPSLIDFLR